MKWQIKLYFVVTFSIEFDSREILISILVDWSFAIRAEK